MPANRVMGLQPGNLRQLENLLRQQQLPFEDCASQLANMVGIFNDDILIAAGGLEPAGHFALLRSVAVVPDRQGQGLAAQITRYLIERARIDGLRALYLLTESAESYFARFGFVSIARDRAPAEIRRTRQFATLCPDSASCMLLPLDDN